MSELTGARLSALSRCPRQAAYTALGAEANSPSDQMERYFARGRVFEEYVVRQFEAKYPGGVETQREIPWPLGVGHADIYIPQEKLLVEVVSTVAPTGAILGFKIEQVKLYLHFDEEAERAAVYVVNPSDLRREDLLPVKLTDEDRMRIETEVAEVEAGIANYSEGPDALPTCCASSPDDCRFGHMCSYTDLAWADWEPPAAEDVPEEAVELLMRLAAKDRAYKAAEANTSGYKHERDEIREALLPLLEPGVEYVAGGVSVKLTQVKGRETFRLAPARTAGAITPGIEEALQPWISVGEPSVRWTLNVDDTAGLDAYSDDYGDEPPF